MFSPKSTHHPTEKNHPSGYEPHAASSILNTQH